MEHMPHSETAVSELLGAIALIGVVSLAVAIVGVSMISQPHEQNLPAVNAMISNNTQKISIFHNGGDILYYNRMKILLDGVDYTSQFTEDGVTGWSTWSVGQTLEYQIPAGQPVPAGVLILYNGNLGEYIIASSGDTGRGSLGILPPTVTGITPSSAPTAAVVAITDLAGSGFYSGATVKLSRYGSPDIAATGVTVVSPSSITCTFDLTGATLGAWNVVVTNPGGASGSLVNGFTVTVASPPVASFVGTPVSGPIPLSVAFTDASTNFPTIWSWTFGDGNTSSDQNPSHTYEAIGNYTVSLTASNVAGGDTATVPSYIFAFSPVVANFEGTPVSGIQPLTVSFTDLSTGAISGWYWVFGDIGVANTSTLRNPAHTYSNVGNYSVNLTVSNAYNSSYLLRTDYITVNTTPPVANFVAYPTSGVAPVTVYFNDTSTGSPTGWLWDFGDIGAGNTSTARNPVHSYSVIGTYSVTLTVSNAGGSNTTVKVNYITAGAPVVANFAGTPTTVLTTQAVQFNDTSTGSPTAWSWVFGDIGGSNTSTLQNPTHTYGSAGTYSVTLTASKTGSSNTTTKANYITVNWGPPAVTGITPSSNTTGATVSITNLAGTGFGSPATVRLARTGYSNISATSVVVVSTTKITCTFNLAGAAAGAWDVVVVNPDGQTGTLGGGFTIVNLAVTGIAPSTWENTSSVSITNLAGTGFLPGATVKLNRTGSSDITGTGVSVLSGSQITCTFPITGAKAGLWNVAVINPGGTSAVLPNGFSITAPFSTIFYNNFDASFTGWTSTGTVARYTGTPRNGTASMRLRNAANTYRIIPTTGYSGITVYFAMGATGLDSGETMNAEWYDGSTYTIMKQITYNGGENDATLRNYQYTLPAGAENNPNFRLRFRLAVNANTEYGYVDDVLVMGTPT